MAYTILVNSTTADADEVRRNFEYIGAGSRLPMGVTIADDLAATTSVYDIGSDTYKWKSAFFSATITCAEINPTQYGNTSTFLKVRGDTATILCKNTFTMLSRSEMILSATTVKVNGLIDKVIEIGDWDMWEGGGATNTTSVFINHSLSSNMAIRSISVIIRNDSNTQVFDLNGAEENGGAALVRSGAIATITSTYVRLVCYPSNTTIFDSTDFQSLSYNRGWIYIKYAG